MTRANGPLAVVGSIAKLLTAGLGTEATIAAVAETLRAGLPADCRHALGARARDDGLSAVVRADDAGRRAAGLLARRRYPEGRGRRFSLEHEGMRLGVMDVVFDGDGAGLDTLPVIADMLSPYLAAAELSGDLAGEVAVQSREIDEHRRFTDLIIDSLPVGLYVVDRDYRIQTWNRKRETGTQGLRRDDVVGRPVFEVLTRQPAAQLRADFDRVFRTGEIQQREIEVVAGGETRYYRLSKIPDASRGRRDHPRDHDRRGPDRVAAHAGADHAGR